MGVIDNAKATAEFAQKIGNPDLYGRTEALRGEIVSLSEEMLKREQENAEMRRVLALRQAMHPAVIRVRNTSSRACYSPRAKCKLSVRPKPKMRSLGGVATNGGASL